MILAPAKPDDTKPLPQPRTLQWRVRNVTEVWTVDGRRLFNAENEWRATHAVDLHNAWLTRTEAR